MNLRSMRNYQSCAPHAPASQPDPQAPPSKRARLTEENLRTYDEMSGQPAKSKSRSKSKSSASATTTDKNFGPTLQRNNVVCNQISVRSLDDIDEVKKRLERPLQSGPPNTRDYEQYLANTEEIDNNNTQIAAYTLLAKRTADREISGYTMRFNYAWSEVESPLTKGLSDAKPDIIEAWHETDYPEEVVDALAGFLSPTAYNIAMPAYVAELKGFDSSHKGAQLQCAYDGALMTEGAHAIHAHMGKSDHEFYGKTQALSVAFNGEILNIYAHHAERVPATENTPAAIKYYRCLLYTDNPRNSLEDFQSACTHIQNAQDVGYQWTTERKDELWAFTRQN